MGSLHDEMAATIEGEHDPHWKDALREFKAQHGVFQTGHVVTPGRRVRSWRELGVVSGIGLVLEYFGEQSTWPIKVLGVGVGSFDRFMLRNRATMPFSGFPGGARGVLHGIGCLEHNVSFGQLPTRMPCALCLHTDRRTIRPICSTGRQWRNGY
jgi:hypothetical protein